MDLSDLSERARVAKQELDRWISAQFLADRTADPHTIITRVLKDPHFGLNADFVHAWVYETVREAIAKVLARQGGIFDSAAEEAPKPTIAIAKPRTVVVHPALKPKPSPSQRRNWGDWLATTTVPPRLKLMTRADLATFVEERKNEGLANLKTAHIAQQLMTRLPEATSRVADHWADGDIAQLMREVDDRTAWIRAEPDMPALAEATS